MREPINPADIRVGDRVERVSESRGVETITRCVIARIEGGIIHAGGLGWSVCDTNAGWFLLDRPDPLAEVVEVVARTLWAIVFRGDCEWVDTAYDQKERYFTDARAVLAAIAERWELVERGKS